MLAIQHLTTLSSVDATPSEFVNNDFSLSVILPESRIDYLIELCALLFFRGIGLTFREDSTRNIPLG
jgi:hypothetical protein